MRDRHAESPVHEDRRGRRDGGSCVRRSRSSTRRPLTSPTVTSSRAASVSSTCLVSALSRGAAGSTSKDASVPSKSDSTTRRACGGRASIAASTSGTIIRIVVTPADSRNLDQHRTRPFDLQPQPSLDDTQEEGQDRLSGVSCIFRDEIAEKLLNDAASGCEAHNLSRVAKAQLLQNVCPMSLNSGRADGQHVGDLLAASSFSDQLQHFALALGERVVSIGDASLGQAPDVVVEDDLRDGRTEEGLARPRPPRSPR